MNLIHPQWKLVRLLEAFARHTRFAIRVFVRSPGLTITIVLTLAVGIGANSAMFAAIDSVLLRPLPFPEADRLVRISQMSPAGERNVVPVRLEDWNRLSSSFESITGYYIGDASDTTGEVAERVVEAIVAPRFVSTWGIDPLVGRGFTEAEHRFGGPAAVIVSERYWRNRLAANPNVLELTVQTEGDEGTSIVGVLPSSFAFPEDEVDLWYPHLVDAPWAQARTMFTWYTGIGRLKNGITLDHARSEMDTVQARLAEQYPDTDSDIRVHIVPLKDTVVGGVRGSLWLLFGAVALLLLIACSNIAALLLSRAIQREHEFAIRYSLGASRSSVAVQVLAEAAVLALVGAALGLLVAASATTMIGALAPNIPRFGEIGLDSRILLYTLVSAVFVTVFCGIVPSVRSTRGKASPAHGMGQDSNRHGLQWTLVGIQVALTVTLLTGAGLLLRSYDALTRVDPGFEIDSILTFRITSYYGESGGTERLLQRIHETIDELSALPGVESAATAQWLPGLAGHNQGEFELVEGRGDSDSVMLAQRRRVAPSYFSTMQIPVLSGQLCRRSSSPDSDRIEVMVNRSFANRYFPNRSAVGLSFIGDAADPVPIVGVVGDARETRLDAEPVPTVYPCAAAPVAVPWFIVRTNIDQNTVARSVREKMNEIEPLRAIYEVAPLSQRIGDSRSQSLLQAVLVTAFALIALFLACVGIYGTLSYIIGLRRAEIGLQMALGATQRDIVTRLLKRVATIIGVSGIAGLALSLAFGRVLSGMLYGVSEADPLTLSAVMIIVLAVAGLAALLPAVRAAQADPMQVLRED